MRRLFMTRLACCWLLFLASSTAAFGDEGSLPARIDQEISSAYSGTLAPLSTDAEFLRRAYLDLAGTIPPVAEVRTFLADASPDKRAALIDRLLASPGYARRMRQAFDVILLERRPGMSELSAEWESYLEKSFADNKRWDQLVRELISADGVDAETRPAMNFLLARGATSHTEQARDLGRLLLGRDFECAQCHNHPTILDYKQADFYGLLAFLNRSYLHQDKATKQSFFAEKGTLDEVKFSSAFTGETGVATPHLPGGKPIDVPKFAPGEELAAAASEGKPPVPKFPLRPKLAAALATGENSAFTRNATNRFWAMMLGRGLVAPLDMQHEANPPSHPELLSLLSEEFANQEFNVKALLRAMALSQTYQRSSQLPENTESLPPETFAVSNSKPLSPEQMVWSMLEATGNLQHVLDTPPTPEATAKYRPDKGQPMPAENMESVLKLFRSVYAAQPGETEDEFSPSLAGALFISNERLILQWLTPRPGNLIDRLTQLEPADAIAEELYLSVLSREPTAQEKSDVADYLNDAPDGREVALREMAWALLASTEFRLNH